MEDWEKNDVLQALNKLLRKEFSYLLPNEGILFNAEFLEPQRLVMVYPLPAEIKRDFSEEYKSQNYLLGPFQLIFSLKNDESYTDSLLSDDKPSYDLTFCLNAYNGKILKEDISSLIFDPESREIQMSESVYKILKSLDDFLTEGAFHLCSGISTTKSLKIESILIELCNGQDSNVVTRSRECSYLVQLPLIFSNEFCDTKMSSKQCQMCCQQQEKMSGLDLLKHLPPGIAIQPTGSSPLKLFPKNDANMKRGGVVILKNGNTKVPLPSRPKSGLPRKRFVENIPVMNADDLSEDDSTVFQDDENDEDYTPKSHVVAENADSLRHKCKSCKRSFRFEQSYVKHFKFCRRYRNLKKDPNSSQTAGDRQSVNSRTVNNIPVFKENDTNIFVCKYCEEAFDVELAMYKHLEMCAKKPSKFTCRNCGRDFQHEINLQKHEARCMGEFFKKTKPVPGQKKNGNSEDQICGSQFQVEKLEVEQCSICLRHLTKGPIYEKHIQLHIERLSEVQKPASCPRCDPSSIFENRFVLNSHFLLVHGHDELKIPCGQCLEMISRGLISQHIQRKHPHNPLLCPECGIAFKAPSLLNRHLRAQHNAGPHENLMCEVCGNVYRERHGLRQHMQTSHFKKRDYLCLECGKGFISAQKLKQHIRIHTGAKPYGCSLCGYRCNRSYNVHAHLRKVHQIEKPSMKTDIVTFAEELKNEDELQQTTLLEQANTNNILSNLPV